MLDDVVFILTLVTALGCGLIAGVFHAFSSFVMGALARLPPAQGIAAMNSINVVVLNPWFLLPFMGTAAACVALIVAALAGWGDADATLTIVGSGLYLIGTILVTGAFNVPRNNALAEIAPDSAEGAARWAGYVPSWTAWNTVRTVAALAAAAALTVALVAD